MKRYKKFEIIVEDMSESQAENLLGMIIKFCEKFGLKLGGGFSNTSDAEILEDLEEG